VGALGAEQAQETRISLGIHFNENCSEGALVAIGHDRCSNATTETFFPAHIASADVLAGTFAVVYGWDMDMSERWANETEILAITASHYACLREAWPDHGDKGRGYGYLPGEVPVEAKEFTACEGKSCVVGCRAIPEDGCEQGAFFRENEDCTVRCPSGTVPTSVNITCNTSALADERLVLCEVPIVYCDDLVDLNSAPIDANASNVSSMSNESNMSSEPDASNASNASGAANASASVNLTQLSIDTGCVIRQITTTTTTMEQVADEDRVLNGCSELRQLRAGTLSTDPQVPPLPVGMPQVPINTGWYYFEVMLEGPWEQVGFFDGEWTGGDPDADAAHVFLAANGGPGVVGAAVRVKGKGLAEFWFSREGTWQNGPDAPAIRETAFSPPLYPAALLRGRSTWVLPYNAWTYFPVSVQDKPITQRSFPDKCRYPLDYVAYNLPPTCRDGFEQLNTPEECSEAAFHIGLEDWTVTLVDLPGWPDGCFYCDVCDLQGDLYLNAPNASGGGRRLAELYEYTANSSAAVCRRFDPVRTTTATSTTYTGRIEVELAMPPLYVRFGGGVCGTGYLPIRNFSECEEAAADLMLPDIHPRNVTLGGNSSIIYWPPGCFHCAACDSGLLYFNERPGDWAVTLAPGDAVQAEPLCRATDEIRTTRPPTTTVLQTTGAPTPPPETTATTVLFYETTTVTTELIIVVDTMGYLTCQDPYFIVVVVHWYERVEVLVGIVLGFVLCCCCPCCIFILFGGCEWVGDKGGTWFDRHPRVKNSACCRGCFCLGRCLWRFCPCIRAVAMLSPRMSGRSPRSARMSVDSKPELTRSRSTSKESAERRVSTSKTSQSSGSESKEGRKKTRKKTVDGFKKRGGSAEDLDFDFAGDEGRHGSKGSQGSSKSSRRSSKASKSWKDESSSDDSSSEWSRAKV